MKIFRFSFVLIIKLLLIKTFKGFLYIIISELYFINYKIF